MSMNKAIHGAVRRDLDRFVAALGAFPAGDKVRAHQLGAAWENFDDQLVHHHEGEHAIAWPALQAVGVAPDLIAAFDAEHAAMSEALTEARAAMADLVRTADAIQAAAALTAVRDLQAATVAHLDHEEAEIEPVYQEHRESAAIVAMNKAFAKVPPSRGGRFFAWVLDGASPDERAAVTREVPGPVLTIIGGIFGRGYRRNIAPVWTD
jgi:hypothetical protein